MSRIGVFICHCGENISRTVDVEKLRDATAGLRGVVCSIDYRYMCSDPGQLMIADAIKQKNLTGVVVACCSPKMHEPTFRRTCAESGLNPYLCEIANIREQCSWVHENRDEATPKAVGIVRMTVERVKQNAPLVPVKVPVTRKALVIGGGIAGIQAALDIADGGVPVVLVEKSPSIGGHMLQLSETFPTLDCSQCIETPKMVDCARHKNITLHTWSEIEEVSGFIGSFTVKIRRKARFVNQKICTGCGDCLMKCPQKKIPSEFDESMGMRTAIFVPSPQAVPNVPVIDKEHCLKLTKDRCGLCEKACPRKAIDFKQQDEIITEQVGAIVVATGFEVLPKNVFGEYGYGKYPDVITGLQFERLASASGPTGGVIKRPSDGAIPKRVVFIHCVGSRDPAKGFTYCSKICCMYTAKHTILYKHKVHDGEAIVFYIDIRSGGKGYEEFVLRAIEEENATYLRGRVSRILREDGKLIVRGADTLSGKSVEIAADMVVLATAMVPPPGIEKLFQKLGVSYDGYKWINEAHPKLRPVETSNAGVYLAGACQGPKDIPEAVSQAGGAASKVLGLLSAPEISREPIIAKVNEMTCTGCQMCVKACPAKAIEAKEIRDRKGALIRVVAKVNEGVCIGCGLCNTTCPSKSIDLSGFSEEQVYAQVAAM